MAINLTLEGIIQFLLDVEMFAPLDVVELSEILSIMDIQQFKKGANIFVEGDIGDGWYVIYQGKAMVMKRAPFAVDHSVAELTASSCFGEMAILDESPRSATISCTEDMIAFRFSRRQFERLLDQDSIGAYKLVHGMACALAERQRVLNQKITELTQELDSLEESVS